MTVGGRDRSAAAVFLGAAPYLMIVDAVKVMYGVYISRCGADGGVTSASATCFGLESSDPSKSGASQADRTTD
jgi:putative Ca2+/H+ antiporter (TMEM165/GDT1 family)